MPTPPPPYSAQWQITGGAWEDAGAWLESDPNTSQPEHYVPGADNAVTISNNGSSGFTVTYNSVDTIWSINTGTVVTLDVQSGSLTMTYGGFIGGTLMVDAGASLSVGAGYKLVVNSGSYTGTLTGAGGLEFIGGAETIDTTNVTISTLELGVNGDGFGSTTTLDLNLTYKHNFLIDDYSGNNAVFNLNGFTFTATATATLDGTVTGSGTFVLTGTATLQTYFDVAGGAKFMVANGATATQTGNVTVGNQNLSSGLLVVSAGGTYDIIGSGNLGDSYGADATITNFGAIDLSDDSSVTLNGNFTNSGTLTVEAGSALTLSGGSEALDGTITGGGELVIGYAADAFFDTTTLDVATILVTGGNAGAFPALKENLTYAGLFEFESQFGTFSLAGHTLTLSGTNDILAGDYILGGTVDVTGAATTFAGSFGSTGSGHATIVKDDGVIDQTGNVNLVGSIQISAGHTYSFTAATSLNGSGQSVVNSGTLGAAAASGTSYLNANLVNKGVLTAAAGNTLDLSGTDTLAGSLTGAGVIQFGFGATVAVNTGTLNVAEIVISGGNGGGTTTFNVSAAYSGVFDFNNQFGTLKVASGKTLTLSGGADTLYGGDIDGGGTISVTGTASFGGAVGSTTATTINDLGEIDQTYNVSFNGALTIGSGHKYVFENAENFSGGSSTILNAGTLSAAANSGTSYMGGVITNNGALSVGAGATLDINGTDTLRGTLSGSGTLWFGFAAQVAVDTTSVSVGEIFISGGNGGGLTTFNASVTYGGVFDFNNQFGTLAIASGKALVLSGMTNTLYGGDIDGGGLLEVTGAANIASSVGSTIATNITDAGSITQAGGVSLNGTLTILGGKTYTIGTASNLGGSSAVIVNSGSLVDNSSTGTSYVGGSITNKGTILAESGALVFNSAVLGTGLEQIDASAYLQLNGASAASQTIKFAGSGAELALNDAADFHSSISAFGHAANESIDLLGFDSNSQKTFQTVSGGLTVNISDGSRSASITFLGTYNQNLFQLNSGSNGELLTY